MALAKACCLTNLLHSLYLLTASGSLGRALRDGRWGGGGLGGREGRREGREEERQENEERPPSRFKTHFFDSFEVSESLSELPKSHVSAGSAIVAL